MGLLHAIADDRVSACVVAELKKNLTKRFAADIRDYVLDELPLGVRAGLRTSTRVSVPLPTRD